MNRIANRVREGRALLIALALSSAVAMPGAASGQLKSGGNQPPVADPSRERAGTRGAGGGAGQAASQSWHAVDPPVIVGLRKANPKMPLQIVVASAEEIANQGVRGNGRVIYRIVSGVLQIVITSPAGAAELAKAFPEMAPDIIAAVPSASEAIRAVVDPDEPADKNVEQRVAIPDPKDPPPPPADFLENPARDNISPS